MAHMEMFSGEELVFTAARRNDRSERFASALLEASGPGQLGAAPASRHAPHRGGLWIAAGVPPLQVTRPAGHTSSSFTADRYGHLYPGAEDEAADALSRSWRRRRPLATLSRSGADELPRTYAYQPNSPCVAIGSGPIGRSATRRVDGRSNERTRLSDGVDGVGCSDHHGERDRPVSERRFDVGVFRFQAKKFFHHLVEVFLDGQDRIDDFPIELGGHFDRSFQRHSELGHVSPLAEPFGSFALALKLYH